jgi:hypothetical protein
MSIRNREDADKYYKVVNGLVDDYMDKWKIRPSSLRRYLKEGSDKFNKLILRNGLKDVDGIKRVLSDVIDDRVSMESDGVLTFESFKFFESDEGIKMFSAFKINKLVDCIFKGVGEADINMEKKIADIFNCSLSEIEVVLSDKHLFKVNLWNKEGGKKDIDIVIFSNDDMDVIKGNLMEFFLDYLVNKEISIDGVIDISLYGLIDKDNFKKVIGEKLDDDGLIKIINETLKVKGRLVDGYFIFTY